MTLTYGSLFSGVGGFDMGFDNAGYECQWQVEWDKHCQQTLAHHWPTVTRYSDVQDVRGDQITPVDVIIYGSPCQDLSVAGKRAGIEGGRSSMFFESVRIFKEMRDATAGTFPRVVIWENVPGALNSNRGADFGAVLAALDDIGAVAQWWNVLDAQFFGVPQRRRRVFLISVFDPAIAQRIGSGEILAVGKGRRRNSSTRKPKGETITDDASNSIGEPSESTIFRTICFTAQRVGEPPRIYMDGTPSLLSRMGTGGNNTPMIVADEPIYSFDTQFGSNANVFEDTSLTLKSTQTSPSIASHTIVRRLTPLECERLMGYPDNHTLFRADGKTNSDSTRYKMCGNGVATPVAQWIATQLKDKL